jgi:hypothetical protein
MSKFVIDEKPERVGVADDPSSSGTGAARRDRRSRGRLRKAVAGLALAAAVAGPVTALTATPAHAMGGPPTCPRWWCGGH